MPNRNSARPPSIVSTAKISILYTPYVPLSSALFFIYDAHYNTPIFDLAPAFARKM